MSNIVTPTVASAYTCAFAPEAQPICTESIYGRVVWADGEPAGGKRIELVPNTLGSVAGTFASYDGATVEAHTDPTGRYEARACPCSALMGFLEVGDGLNCQIVMSAVTPSTNNADLASLRNYNGVQADPGDQVIWIVGKTACRSRADSAPPGSITQAWLDGMNP